MKDVKTFVTMTELIHGLPFSQRFALVKFGGGITAMSGSIAGNTFARNRYGSYVRARTKPVNVDSALQQEVRTVIAFLADRWAQTLTGVQRTAWNDYAAAVGMKNKLGETIHLSGFNHYIRSNSYVKRRAETLYDDGPTDFTLPAQDPTLEITTEVHEQRFNIHFDDTMDWTSETGAWLFMLQGKPQNPQRNFFAGPYKGVKDKAGDDGDGPTTPEQSTNLWVVAEGQKVWYQLRIQRADGRLSEPWTVQSTVVAGPLPPP
ncbi:hypothetical protein ES703_30965 [subsurface metagenome]